MSDVLTSHLIGIHWKDKSKKQIIGFKILGMPSGRVIEFVPISKLIEILRTNPNGVEGIHYVNGELVGSNGQFSRYPAYVNGKSIEIGRIVILTAVGNAGYEVYLPDGKILTLRNSDIIALAKKFDIANGKLSSKNSTEFISSISGDYIESSKTKQLNTGTEQSVQNKVTDKQEQSKIIDKSIQPVDKTNKLMQNSGSEQPMQSSRQYSHKDLQDRLAKKIAKAAIKSSIIPDDTDLSKLDATKVINIESSKRYDNRHVSSSIDKNSKGGNIAIDKNGNIVRGSENIDNTMMTVDQMMAISMLQLRTIKPFFFAALKVIKRIETTTVPTMGVTIDTFYYNPEFVATMSISELNFLHLHEISHIAMKHKVRELGKDHEIWNIACDYYINKAICEEFGIKPNSGPAKISGSNATIEFPKCGGCYNENIDVMKDTPELIYDELQKSIQKAKQNQRGQGQGQQGQGQQGQGQGQQGPGQGQQGQGQGQQGQGQGQQGQGQQGQGQQGQGQQGQGQQGQGQGQQGQGQNIAQSNIGSQPIYVNFRGEKIKIDPSLSADIVSDDSTAGDSETSREQRAQATLQKIDTVYKKITESTDKQGRGKGGLGVVEDFVEKELIPKVNWRALVQNRLIAKQTDEYSLSSPDRRFIHKGVYIEGRVTDEEKIEGIKLCIDTSGSMSDRDIAIAIGQIMQLCKMYDTQADLVYWDDGIQDIVPYEKLEESNLRKYQAMGRGGTDPNCIFEEFSKKEYKFGMKVAPSLIIIFTDGYFGSVDPKYKRAFGQDTIWVLCSENSMPIEDFHPTFGRVAKFRK